MIITNRMTVKYKRKCISKELVLHKKFYTIFIKRLIEIFINIAYFVPGISSTFMDIQSSFTSEDLPFFNISIATLFIADV